MSQERFFFYSEHSYNLSPNMEIVLEVVHGKSESRVVHHARGAGGSSDTEERSWNSSECSGLSIRTIKIQAQAVYSRVGSTQGVHL